MNEDTTPNWVIHDHEKICGFFGRYRFLSNFYYVCPVYYEGIRYASSEHAYQAAKTKDSAERRKYFAPELKPAQAKSHGSPSAKLITFRADWEQVKVDIMSAIVFDKFFRHLHLRKMLLETEDRYLEETNSWNDMTWGRNLKGEGTNYLGKILMNVREFWKNKPEK